MDEALHPVAHPPRWMREAGAGVPLHSHPPRPLVEMISSRASRCADEACPHPHCAAQGTAAAI
ncbi:hypothetical protein FH972_021127 [Carpinus fangiana]|uniref:Uncharacterized protein n=1 Tax=Carpinus fangiana TaxID=176857 RepID=A0A5N6KNF5_9ROSI|nr:hypothetical protein FH972_021127 [Carpinus fangiana]